MRTRRHTLTALVASLTAATLLAAAPAAAHDWDDLGYGGPFDVRVDNGFDTIEHCTTDSPPDCDGAVFVNGEVDIHLEPGRTVIAIGRDGEPMAKLDEDGNMFANTKSPTWWMNLDEDMGQIPADADPTAEPVWEWQQAGGALSYHEHRIHFMAAAVSPSIADGGDVSTFSLDFIVDDEPVTVTGALVFVPELDPEEADCLVRAGQGDPCSEPFTLPTSALVGGGVVLLVAACVGGFVFARRFATSN